MTEGTIRLGPSTGRPSNIYLVYKEIDFCTTTYLSICLEWSLFLLQSEEYPKKVKRIVFHTWVNFVSAPGSNRGELPSKLGC